MQRRATVAIGAVCLALALPGAATAGSISGTVTDGISGKPIAGIWVGAGPVGYGLRDYTETAPDGTYDVGNLEAGQFNVCFLPGDGVNLLRQCWHDASQPFYGEAINVPAEGRVTGIDGDLAPGTSVAGRVTDWEGHPLDGVCIAAWSPSGGGQRRASVAGTNAHGEYTIVGLDPGTPNKIVFAPDGGPFSGCPSGQLHPGFVNQWFNGKSNMESADAVSAARSETVAGVNGALGPSPTPPASATAARARCIVPRLRNKTFTAARALLIHASCSTPMPATRRSPRFRRGHVIKSRPGPGKRIRRGARVKLVVSKGR